MAGRVISAALQLRYVADILKLTIRQLKVRISLWAQNPPLSNLPRERLQNLHLAIVGEELPRLTKFVATMVILTYISA